jgi:hypothetical protein
MSGPVVQNVSLPADDDAELDFTLSPTGDITLGPGSEIFFDVYEQQFGQPIPGTPAVLSYVLNHGIQITNPDLLQFTVTVARADTVGLLRNYYYECRVMDVNGSSVTTTVGIFTITGTEIRV